ncbi:MAG: Spy/CpxP family protein refolding chaperone [Fibrobacterota bacterium]
MKKMPLLTLVAFCLMCASAALAAPPPPDEGRMGPHEKGDPREVLKKELGLSEDQLKKIDAVKIETEKAVEKNRYEIKNEKLTLQEQALKGTLTRVTLKESLKKINDNMSKTHTAFFQAALSVTDVLTDEQIKKLGEKKLLQRVLMIGEHPGMGGQQGKECRHEKGDKKMDDKR